ncbi:hypothetical protein [Segatella sp.]
MKIHHTTYRKIIAALILLSCTCQLFAQGKIYRVTAKATTGGDGSSWEKAIPLIEALSKAKATDEIWVKGYKTTTLENIYVAPKEGFVLPSGVAMYGGFEGTETSKDKRGTGKHKFQMTYLTTLIGDINKNDEANKEQIIYPENPTRTDNSTHVLTLNIGVTDNNPNANSAPTIVSGFQIGAGNAQGKVTAPDGRGGGIYVVNKSSRSDDSNADKRAFQITQCNIANNFAMRGGAIYVDASCTNPLSSISYCGLFNNVAGRRGASDNEGAGIWADGTVTIYNTNINNNTNGGVRLSATSKIINCSVVANTVSAVDLVNAARTSNNGGGAVYNTVLWHSTAVSKADTRPAFYNCAMTDVKVTNETSHTDANGNVRISSQNHSTEPAAWFTQSVVSLGYDYSFQKLTRLIYTSFAFEETSALLGKGNLEYYKKYIEDTDIEKKSTDVMGKQRYESNSIDIGAYEYERLMEGRIRYVKVNGTGKGTSWDDAMGDIQDAINSLADDKGTKGEVWVAEGTYMVTKRIDSSTGSPTSLLMKDGISVYGAFAGGETTRAQRIAASVDLKPWGWKHETILKANGFNRKDASWSENDEAWNIKSSSSHVVWFAPLPGGKAFSDNVYLEGFTIEGGSYQQQDDEIYEPQYGAGVYINDANAKMRYCTVRYCNPGATKTPSQTPKGGGIYCKNGMTEGNLVYNCSAYQGGGIYIDEAGYVTRSMVTNCSANLGAGVYLQGSVSGPAYYQILSTSVISNNTSTRNGAVYVDGRGLVINNTITNNYTDNTSDVADQDASYTGGVYIKEKGLLANNILWNNSLPQSSSASKAQVYAANPSKEGVQFYNNAISDVSAASWNDTYQTGTLSINNYYSGKGFVMGKAGSPFTSKDDFDTKRGVIGSLTEINYYWELYKGTRLRNEGISFTLLPSAYLYQPQIDLSGKPFKSVPSIGAYMAENHDVVFEKNTTTHRLRIYFDRSQEILDGTGESWKKSYTSASVDELIEYLATIQDGEEVDVVENGSKSKHQIDAQSEYQFEICSRAGTFAPTIAYMNEESDAKSRAFRIQPTVLPLNLYGAYPKYEINLKPADTDRHPIKHRTELNGNINGTTLSEGLYHLVRIESGARVTINGYTFTHAYAAGTAYMPYGGGVLIGSVDDATAATSVKFENCIFEDNTAMNGAAISTMPDAENVSLELVNCVVNNNTSEDTSVKPSIIYLNPAEKSNNTLKLTHVSIVNNVGVAPANNLVKATSFAAGNMLKMGGVWNYSECNNSLEENFNTLGKEGALNFMNPTKEIGAKINGNVYYGGYASFRPLTSSSQAGVIINSVPSSPLETDILGDKRNQGGEADLGAYEALLPKTGKIIYVRSYNTDYTSGKNANYDDQDGKPDFDLLKHTDIYYDGTSWDKAIIGNAMCDKDVPRNNNLFYVKQSDKTLLSTTIDNKDYSQAGGKYRSKKTDSYGDFWGDNSGNSYKDGYWPNYYNTITNNRDEQYISGLQYAVERAAELNKNLKAGEEPVVVWVGAGVYTDYKGFVIRDNVKVYGGFPHEGYPGESDRHPLLSQYVPARKEYQGLDVTKYETILQIRKESPVYFKNGDKEMWYQEGKSDDGSKYDYTKKLINNKTQERHYVLYQPDVCIPTWSQTNDGTGNRWGGNSNRYPGSTYPDDKYVEYKNAKWDGFSIRHGYIVNYKDANRDGGAGVRVFRGVELENLIIVNNFNHGSRVRGGGLYMDGENSKISNSYLLRNLSMTTNKENYGGGAYMIQGTGYNLVVANNRCGNGAQSYGGGIFLESAKFYNNTIAYNMSAYGTGIYHWQDQSTGVPSQLSLYNCLIYDNHNGNKEVADQVNSLAWDKMKPSHNCYMNSSDDNKKFLESNGNFTGTDLAFPFEDKTYESGKDEIFRFRNARLTNNFRLNEKDGLTGNKCLNGGSTDVGTGVKLPETDMDYTDRIKDCQIDIGAYEADNTANITAQEKKNSEGEVEAYVYYVTQNGYGNRSGDSPENAACADKLQSVLTQAGEKFKEANKDLKLGADNKNQDDDKAIKVYVKVAGYEADESGNRFVYHANTLADPTVPQSYTFLIPNGVWLMGGYNEGTQKNGVPDPTTYNWDKDQRDCIRYQTILSAKTQVKEGTTVTQEVNGYHTVTFGKWPSGEIDTYFKDAVGYRAVVDGCRLIDGNATEKTGYNSIGGAAIVPRSAHVRNCLITDCQATKGGALYLLKGGIVSGSVITRNSATDGGAIYAARITSNTKKYHAYVISCTIADNTATSAGGGIFQEDYALISGNSVIWGNSAASAENISCGDTELKDEDVLQDATLQTQFYPYDYCFVEKMNLPANAMNTEMTSDLNTYFASKGYYYPRAYSPLIGNGIDAAYIEGWKSYGVSNYDILGNTRHLSKRQTAGAYALDLPEINKDKLLTRLFVSNEGGEEVSDELKQKYYGRSFLTPFNSLDAALDYIEEVRKQPAEGSPLATEVTHFEILMTGGTYKPSQIRKDVSNAQTNKDRRLQSFTIPVNVDIYGSFSVEDNYSSDPEGTVATESFTSLGNITLRPDMKIKDILSERNKNHMADNNKNGLIDPWEFKNPTIFSGDIKESEKERKVYHVVYSRKKTTGTSAENVNDNVVLDGITIMNGETMTELATNENTGGEMDEIGRGGAIYTDRVHYTLNRCRLIKNTGLHGGAIYANNASFDIIGSYIGGNRAITEEASATNAKSYPGMGGAIYLYLTDSKNGNLHIVNSLIANNDVTSGNSQSSGIPTGGAIYIRRAGDAGTTETYHDVNITNSIIVNNKANQDGAIHIENESSTITPILYNTVIWGNESQNPSKSLKRDHMQYCAWDELPATLNNGTTAEDGNIMLGKDNLAVNGPCFASPSTTKGYAGYSLSDQWNPRAISVLTDAGLGDKNNANKTDAYQKWWEAHLTRLRKYGYPEEYVRYSDPDATDSYLRYVGPIDENGVVSSKPIDIGLYEFQYVFKLTDRDQLYIGTEQKGKGDGSDWNNQSTDLRGAIIAMANATGKETTHAHKKVYVRGGTYYSPTYSGNNDAFTLFINKGENASFVQSLEIVGGCTGKNINGKEEQDFSNPSVLIENPTKKGQTEVLLNITTNDKPVTLSGFTFTNESGVGVKALINKENGGTGEEMVIHHSSFRHNKGIALDIDNSAQLGARMWNLLFADGDNDAIKLNNSQGMHLVNVTFVKNKGQAIDGTASVYNSIAWKNGTNSIKNNTNNNVVIADGVANGDVLKGPNFVNPDKEDYRIRPSLLLMNKGNNTKYIDKAKLKGANDAAIFASEKDLANTSRLIGESIDIGAYECDAKMQPIIYVNTSSAINGTGENWKSPSNDLKGAISLAELYANKKEGYGYVFVDRNLQATDININMPGVKMYGSMNGETSSAAPDLSTLANIQAVVKDLLRQRKGIIEASTQSSIKGLTIDNQGTGSGKVSLVDGFKISGNVSLKGNSMLSTSIIDGNISGDANGMLYNSLALGTVDNVKSVNVTAEKALPETSGSAANRSSVITYNKYVKDDYWKYQLDETDNVNINANTDVSKTQGCIDKVMHNHDLAGNQRIRDKVDNGCFETWYLTADKNIVDTDYPHGKSVVYVMEKDKELILDNNFYKETNPFSPGFLLLKYHSGLRGNNSYVALNNFAVERELKKGTNLFMMPFDVTKCDFIGTEDHKEDLAFYQYHAEERANYDFKFGTDSGWGPVNYSQINSSIGFRVDAGKENITIRFYGDEYNEQDGSQDSNKQGYITLKQNNNQQPWSDNKAGGLKFTHKENMGWNLFGSPYLCAMNFGDMEYGRVIYTYDETKGYTAINTDADATNSTTSGYIPAMDAIFTQTATLDNTETIRVKHSSGKDGDEYASNARMLNIAISKRSETATVEDHLQLATVPAQEAKSDFDLGSDGVKWMMSRNPQIYATRSGGRYSLLSAVSIEAEQNIGVSLPEAGEYTISIPEDCDASEYETVWLKDKETGKAVDLKEGSYPFYAAQAGEINNRFNISFNRKETDMNSDITIISSGNYHILIKGLKQNDLIRIYGTSGVLALQKQAKSDTEQLRSPVNGTVAVEVTRGGKQIAVKKIALK